MSVDDRHVVRELPALHPLPPAPRTRVRFFYDLTGDDLAAAIETFLNEGGRRFEAVSFSHSSPGNAPEALVVYTETPEEQDA